MKDIDFEELDRAVSSLLSDTPTQPAISDDSESEEKVLDLGGSGVDNTTNVVAVEPTVAVPLPTTPISEPKPAASSVASQPSLAGRRSSGQFMDLVHTSSNMRRPTTTAAPTSPTSEASNLQGSMSVVTPVAPAPVDITPEPQTEIIADSEAEINEEKPLESPFIAGTVVDKRPLGAFSDNQTEQSIDKLDDASDKPVVETNLEGLEVKEVPKSESEPEKLPDELQDELLKIESDESIGKLADEKPAEELKPTPADETSEVSMPQSSGSITQQYEEHPSTGEQTSGAIYNTDNYHKSLVVPKKKSGWLWVLLIFLLILLGAAAGAGFFIYIAPNL